MSGSRQAGRSDRRARRARGLWRPIPLLAGVGEAKKGAARLKRSIEAVRPVPMRIALRIGVTSACAWMPASVPVPPENVTTPLSDAMSKTTCPVAVLPEPASRVTSVSSEASPAASA